MNVLHVIDHFSLGGAQRIVEGILHAQPDELLLPLRKKGAPKDQIPVSDEQYLLKPEGNLFFQLLRLLKAPHLIPRRNIDIVHCHLPYSWLFGLWLSVIIPVNRRPRLIFHEHDSIKLVRWYYPLLIRAAHRAGTLVAVSKYIQQQIASHGIPLDDIHLLLNYVDTDRFSPGEPSGLNQFQLNPAQFQPGRMIGFAGRLVGYKGWKDIISAAGRLRDANVRFIIAGDGPDASKLRREVEQMGLQNTVIQLGYVDKMVDFYRMIDVLVIASQRESFGLVQLEAQACGVPVVLYESQAALELQGAESSILVPYGDIDALVEKIELLLHDQTYYQRLVEKGLDNVRPYGLQPYLQRMMRIYEQVMTEEKQS
jgi:glycosyltransferase involved in cell wall biosynthesis